MEVAATGAVAEETVVEDKVVVPAPVAVRVLIRAVTAAASAPRRKTFSTSRSTWTSGLPSSSTGDAKVRHVIVSGSMGSQHGTL